MSKQNQKSETPIPQSYIPLEAHLLRDNVGGQVSVFVRLPIGVVIQAPVMPALPPALFEQYEVVVQPPGAPEFETAKVFMFTEKAPGQPEEKE